MKQAVLTSYEIKVDPEVMERIISYLSVCESKLSKNVEAPIGDGNTASDSGKIGSPYYLTLFHKILKRVRFLNADLFGNRGVEGKYIFLF